jgi:putative membrane protein
MNSIFLYNLFLSLHIISVIAWMAGLLYLPRLFVYHFTKEVGSETSETFKLMEIRLLRIIMNPAMIFSWLFGIALISTLGVESLSALWLQLKVVFVLLLSGVHGYLAKITKEFQQDRRLRSERFYRIINEFPTVLMIIIVFLVIFKPI